jgi:Asp-tRNA(Asn)/Glu-tRNA(Gln) amidotransferase C subunit
MWIPSDNSLKHIIMKTKVFTVVITIILLGSSCFSQQEESSRKPQTIEQRLQKVQDKICQPLTLKKEQSEAVLQAFKDFYTEMEKLRGNNPDPQVRPDKSKVDALKKIRDDKVKQAITEAKFAQYLELEKELRPQRDGKPINR